MSTTNRAGILTKAHRVLKKHYKPCAPPTDRTLLEHLLYACCLQNARYEQADEAFALLGQSFYDWNEVRVTTVAELAEVMSMLPDAPVAAARLKRSLHNLFETHYSFDIELLRKQNQGKAIKELEKIEGITKFVVAYVTQQGLGGHAIPLSDAAYDVLELVGAISPADVKKQRAPGLERAIPKSKGGEFGSLLHQLAVDYQLTPFSNRVRGIIVDISADAKDRFPKRQAKAPAKKNLEAEPKKKAAKKVAPKAASKSPAAPKKPKKKPAAASKKTAASSKKSSTKRLAKKKPR